MTGDQLDLYDHRPPWLDNMNAAWELANRLQRASEFVPATFANRPEAIMAAILTGIELDVQPLWALRNVAVIKGRVSLSAEAMRALVLRAGHAIWQVEATDARVVMAGRRRGLDVDPLHVEWTWRMATSAGLVNGENWKRYPRAMLTARATTELCRVLFPDVIAGIVSTDEVEDYDGVEAPPQSGSASVSRRRNRRSVRKEADADPQPALGDAPDRVDSPPVDPAPAADVYDALLDDDGDRCPTCGVPFTAPASDECPVPEQHVAPDSPDAGGLELDGEADELAGQLTIDGDVAEVIDPDEVRVRKRFFAHLRDALPDMSRADRDRYRRALVAIVTRDRESGPTPHFADTDDVERQDLAKRLADLRAQRVLYATEADGTVVFTSHNRRALVMAPDDLDAGKWSVVIEDRD